MTFADLRIGDEFIEDGDRFVKIKPEPLTGRKRKFCGERGSMGGCRTPVNEFFNARAMAYGGRRVHFCPNDEVIVPAEVAA